MQNYLFISDTTIPLVYPKITLIIFESSTHQQLLELTVCYIPPPPQAPIALSCVAVSFPIDHLKKWILRREQNKKWRLKQSTGKVEIAMGIWGRGVVVAGGGECKPGQ